LWNPIENTTQPDLSSLNKPSILHFAPIISKSRREREGCEVTGEERFAAGAIYMRIDKG
jgi:hypothetical protein